MDSKVVVSVSVVTYNHKDYIKQCLDGILMQQTDFDLEIILGEDESDDGTREICMAYAKKYPDKIHLFLRSRKDVIYINGRPTGRFNMMENLKACKGKYIALCEGDDYWTDPLKLQKQVDFLETNPNFKICYHPVKLFNQSKVEFSKHRNVRKVADVTDITDLAKGNYIYTNSVMFKNDVSLPIWFKNCTLGDWTLYMLIVGTKKIKRLSDVISVYRIHQGGIWSQHSEEEKMRNTNRNIRLLYFSKIFPKDVKTLLKTKIDYYNLKLPASLKVHYGIKEKLKFYLRYGNA